MNLKQIILAIGLVTAMSGSAAWAQAPANKPDGIIRPFGPPDFVIQAWETGELPQASQAGPPAWVIESWASGQRPTAVARKAPEQIQQRHAKAAEAGLPGPPAEVIEAWKNGNGWDLPGPPAFILEWLGW
ncbi:MAG: hypothetical protein R3C28_08020 [Pirellulaceae bacterium]